MSRTKFLIVPLLAAPVLFGCSNPAPAELPPPSEAAQAAVVQKPGANRDRLIRAADALFTDPETEETRALLVLHDGQIVAERYGAGYGRDTRFLDGRDDMSAYAEAQPLEANPGSKWEYSSATTVILADLAARALTPSSNPVARMNAVRDYLRTRLFEPIGMKGMVPEFDAAGTLIGGSLMHGTARDFAKFGEFLRNRGSVNGAQLVPSTWIDFMTSPSPRNAGYGGQLWLNRKQPDGTVQWPGAPASTFSMNGHLGQYGVGNRSNGVVVVRLGKTQDDAHAPLRAALARIVMLFPRE